MFGLKRKKNAELEFSFDNVDANDSFQLPIDDREALNIVSEKRKKGKGKPEPAPIEDFASEPKKKGFAGLFSRKKNQAAYSETGKKEQEKKAKKKRLFAKRGAGTGRKKLVRYYRRIFGVGLVFSLIFLFLSFGGRLVLNMFDSQTNRVGQNAIPESSRSLYNDYTTLKQRYDKFNFDAFKLLIENDNKSKPQTDEEKLQWRDSLVALFGDSYIRNMKGQARELREHEIETQVTEAVGEVMAAIPNYSVVGVSRTGQRTLVTIRGQEGTEYWTFDKNGRSDDAPEGLVAFGLDLVGTDTSAPGFYVGARGHEGANSVFVPLTGIQAQKVDSGAKKLQETKRKQSYAAVTTPDGQHKMVSMNVQNRVAGDNSNQNTEQTEILQASNDHLENLGNVPVGAQIDENGNITVTNSDGSVEQITLPEEVRGQIQNMSGNTAQPVNNTEER